MEDSVPSETIAICPVCQYTSDELSVREHIETEHGPFKNTMPEKFGVKSIKRWNCQTYFGKTIKRGYYND